MKPIEHLIQLTDGRNIAVLEQGPADGKPVIYLHGAPGSYRDHSDFDELYRQQGLRMVSVNRPGTGSSTASGGWGALSFAADLRQVLDQLSISKATVIGFSAGGLYGCAFAHQYPERVERLALLSSVGPFDLPQLGNKRTEATKAFHDTAKENPAALLEQLSAITTAEALLALVNSLISSEDKKVFALPEVASQMRLAYADVLAQGLDKLIKEIAIINSPWGFSPAEIMVDTRLWHGTADINVPVECSEYLAEQIPAATASYVEGGGHYFSFEQWPELLQEITSA
ncbi:MAG: alpha/beta hydrolase [Pseudomonadota bacterium]